MKFLPLLWAGLWRKRSRTIFTLLSMIVAFLLFGMLQGVNAAFSQGVAGANLNRLYVYNRISFTELLPIAYLPQIEKIANIEMVAHSTWFGSYYQDPKNFVHSFPTNAEQYFNLYPELRLPRDQLDALIRTRTGAVVGVELAKKYGWKIGDEVTLHSRIWSKLDGSSDWAFNIVGIFDIDGDKQRSSSFVFNYTYFDEARSFGKGTVGWYILRVSDPSQAADVAAAVDRHFLNSTDETSTQTEKESTQTFLKQFGDINFIVSGIVGAVFFTLLFLTGNTVAQSVRERIPEFAVMKTLGFTDFSVSTLVFAETLLLCEIAACIGLAMAAAMFPALKGVIGIAVLPLRIVILGLLSALILAVLTSFVPAQRMRKLQIIDALAN